MRSLYLIDQSLEGIGGHHLDFAESMSRAALEQGLKVVIGAHRRFRSPLHPPVPVAPLFRTSSYSRDSYLAGLDGWRNRFPEDTENPPPFAPSRWHRWRRSWFRWRSNRRRQSDIRRFADDLETFFATQKPQRGDVAFLATVTELDLMGLAAFLSNHRWTLHLSWHLLFHYNVFEGRPAEYDRQTARAEQVERCLVAALNRVLYHDIRLYTTNELLTQQFNRLNAGGFQTLRYPLHPSLLDGECGRAHREAAAEPDRPRLLTCAGAVRREKGQRRVVQMLIDQLWDDGLAAGRVRLQLQQPPRRWGRRTKLRLALPRGQVAPPHLVERVDHPLPTAEYVQLIRSADIGLLAYDPRVYFARRAGILGEYLRAGRPVVVLAGSWLSAQLADAAHRHVSDILRHTPQPFRLGLPQCRCDPSNTPQHGGVATLDSGRRPFRFEFAPPAAAGAAVVQFSWHCPTDVPSECRVDWIELAADGTTRRRQRQIAPRPPLGQVCRVLFQLDPAAAAVRVELTNPFDERSLQVRDLEIVGLKSESPLPRSAVGVIAADLAAIPDAVREVLAHYNHYRRTAMASAAHHAWIHRPEETLRQLLKPKYRHGAA